MKLVNTYGGHSIGVYNSETMEKAKVHKMMRDRRIKYYAPADYSDGSELDKLIKAIIDRTVSNENLESYFYKCKTETEEADKQTDEAELKKIDLIMSLENSKSFARTHSLISELSKQSKWSMEEKEALFNIALYNGQVKYILKDIDVTTFYRKLLKSIKKLSESAQAVKNILDDNE